MLNFSPLKRAMLSCNASGGIVNELEKKIDLFSPSIPDPQQLPDKAAVTDMQILILRERNCAAPNPPDSVSISGAPRLGASFQSTSRTDAVKEGRAQRFGGLSTEVFGGQGAVNKGAYQTYGFARASAGGSEVRQGLSYLEGGNVFTGTRADGQPYALVGKDSIHVTAELLKKQSAREWTPAEVTRVIAADLGLEPHQIVAVEQPGDFYLNMRLTSLKPGEILLNDSRAAAQQQIVWLHQALEEQLKSGQVGTLEAGSRREQLARHAELLTARAEQLAPFEDMAASDLSAAGLTVHRLGGAFLDPTDPKRDRANFFNTRQGTNPQGQRYAIMMGAEAHEEAYIAQKVMGMAAGTLSRIHFLDSSKTAASLDMSGGLKCRTKTEGELVAPGLLTRPNVATLNEF